MLSQSRNQPIMPTPVGSFTEDRWSDDSWPEERATGPKQKDEIAGRLFSVSIPAPKLSGFSILSTSETSPRFYWAESTTPGSSRECIVGRGIAAELLTDVLLGVPDEQEFGRFNAIRAQLNLLFADSHHVVLKPSGELERVPMTQRHPARPRLMGGFAFSPEFVPDNTWSVFHPAHFVLPHYQFVESGESRWLTLNAVVDSDEQEGDIESGLVEALLTYCSVVSRRTATDDKPDQASLHQPHSDPEIRYPMSVDQWDHMVTLGVSAINDAKLEKVVLSRVGEIRPGHAIEPLSILDRLNEDYPNCYRFIFEPMHGHFFLGATPELLVRKVGNEFQTMALAGSIRRGQSDAEDVELAKRLLTTPKERHEHQVVVDEIRSRLAALSIVTDNSPAPTVLQLHNIQHLLTLFDGRDNDLNQHDALSLVEQLHPTPALGGAPVNAALQFLTDVEPVPRGWYAAPIGWLDANLDGEFAVAIRSAVCQHDRAWLYAGAGIMADSVAAREWAETELKFKPMLDALTQSH